MSQSKINKQIALTIICVILSSVLLIVSFINFELLWLKIVMSSLVSVLLIVAIFFKTVALSKEDNKK